MKQFIIKTTIDVVSTLMSGIAVIGCFIYIIS
jgi:hypothetical protein